MPADLNAFAGTWFAPDAMVEELVTYGEKQGVKRNPVLLAKCYNELKLQLKARIARTLFGDIGQYKVYNDDDPAVEKAMQLLKSGERVARK